jgi:hypothetical protein
MLKKSYKHGGVMRKRLFLFIMAFALISIPANAATHDYVIENQPGAAFRSDLNGALSAIVTNNSSAAEPLTMYPNMWWYDISTSLLKRRNNANSAWIVMGLEAASTDGTMAGNSDSLVPTQKAAKTYSDTKIASTYLDTDTTLAANSDVKIATQKASKAYIDLRTGTPSTAGYSLQSAGAGSAPVYSQVDLSGTEVTGNLPVTKLNSGTNASSSTFWRGDGSWVALSTVNIAEFTSSGTWTAPAGVTKIWVSGCGGGGGGGSGWNTQVGGGGGGSGAYSVNAPLEVVAGNTYTITIGAKGLGGVGSGVKGTSGTDTTFTHKDGTLTLKAGLYGSSQADGNSGGAGGVGIGAPTGAPSGEGGGGKSGIATATSGFAGVNGGGNTQGGGGGGYFGAGGSASYNANGGDASGYGSGGAGGGYSGYGLNYEGGDGAPGYLMIRW